VADFESDDPVWTGVLRDPMTTVDDEVGAFPSRHHRARDRRGVARLGPPSTSLLAGEPWRPVELGASPDDSEGTCDPEVLVFDDTKLGRAPVGHRQVG